MTTYTLTQDNGADVRFTGAMVASASSYHHHNIWWCELELYQTQAGTWIAHKKNRTRCPDEHDRFTVHVCPDESAVIAALGHGRLAKNLYAAAGIEDVAVIE